MRNLRVTLVQSMLHWEDVAANRAMFAEKLAGLKGTTDLIVLPEMFTTGFTMNTALAETMEGATVQWMKEQAALTDAAIFGSVIIAEAGMTFNRGLFVTPDGEVQHYDKRHLFRYANETDHFSAGDRRVVVEWREWRVLLQICFDLRFPVFARNRGDYDAALYVANWPEARSYPWSQLLIARAIENQCYAVGVNRVGMDGKGIHYSGDSVAIEPKGQVLASCTPKHECITSCTFDAAVLADFRAKFPVGMEADDFDLKG
ncbi:MAG: amidohydrolase [Flavobacteriales bacterium]|mgnify:CR=1 FL=1|jgi:omega-amidase|nr:amidohydrolase [Flavobacteriales bacterium]MBK6551993.1 amidohydrolase [Flavobacteriales bacterium]MBK6883365.1 amidohydrolase [Flavobacteriales bacterium]MBK7620732.1 amidohydrolase [Flavobacteriales bacterium]HQW05830.1 amidohydrolase [Flavobacteriales bacterium]